MWRGNELIRNVLRCLIPTLLFAGGISNAQVNDFARLAELISAEISPGGQYLSVLREENEKRTLVVFTYPEMKILNVIDFPGNNEVGDYDWVNDERLLIRIDFDFEVFGGNRTFGELYAINADGSKGKYLFGRRADQGATSSSRVHTVRAERGAGAFLEQVIWDDPDHVLITIQKAQTGPRPSIGSTALMNVYTGRLTRRNNLPTFDAQVLAEPDGTVRFAVGVDDDQNTVIYERDPQTGDWQVFSSIAYGQAGISPVTIDEDGVIYVVKSEEDRPGGIYALNPETKNFTEIYQHELVDVYDVFVDWRGHVYGVTSMPDFWDYRFTDEQHPSAQLSMSLLNAFERAFPVVTSTSRDFRLSVVRLREDTRTREFYIYDAAKGELSLLFDSRPWIDDSILPQMQPISFKARDGLELHGYLTIPHGARPENLPLVVVPHGGPHGPRDMWGYPAFEGFIPAHGYAMLMVNYRGSGGYGTAFERKGYKQWPTAIQDDITDGVRWTIEQGIADPERICIFGWSFGGYSALMSIIREPDLYKCSVGGAGVYEARIQYESDFAEFTRWGRKYLEKVVGDDEEHRLASATTFVDRIRTPVLLIHGDEDDRVPIENAYALQRAYKKAGKKAPRLITLKNEPHSPRKESSYRKIHGETIKFIEKHIGKGVIAN